MHLVKQKLVHKNSTHVTMATIPSSSLMKNARTSCLCISVALLFVSVPVHAEDEIQTGSGGVLTIEERMKKREERANGFRNAAFKMRKKVNAFKGQREMRKEKRKEHREKCRSDIRRSNKGAKVNTLLRCYRAELTLENELLRKRRLIIEDLPNISETIKVEALSTLDELSDAISAIIDAIDTGVYTSQEELREAKQNLHTQYRQPYWHALMDLRADKMMVWIAHLGTRIDTILAGNYSETVTEQLVLAAACLDEAEVLFEQALAETGYQESKELLRQAQSKLKSCTPFLRAAHKAKKDHDNGQEDESAKTEAKSQKKGLAFV